MGSGHHGIATVAIAQDIDPSVAFLGFLLQRNWRTDMAGGALELGSSLRVAHTIAGLLMPETPAAAPRRMAA
jgi:hypothetical protein